MVGSVGQIGERVGSAGWAAAAGNTASASLGAEEAVPEAARQSSGHLSVDYGEESSSCGYVPQNVEGDLIYSCMGCA